MGTDFVYKTPQEILMKLMNREPKPRNILVAYEDNKGNVTIMCSEMSDKDLMWLQACLKEVFTR